ncbi:MAG: hypothetical protein MN733_04485 [Nitrososphaera sp.]|nr:hypothetical protein [Nitrososphaera sp.]
MASLLELIDKYIFSGVPSNAAWDAIKLAWEKANKRSWEELFLDSFERTVEDEHPRLEKYADAGGDIRLDRKTLYTVLHYDLSASIPSMTLHNITDQEFGEAVATALAAREALIIGGHNLDEDDYKSIVIGLVRKSTALFKKTVLLQRQAFEQAILDQGLENTELVLETLSFVETRFDIVLQRIGEQSAVLEKIFTSVEVIQELILGFTDTREQAISLGIPSPDSKPLAPEGYIDREQLVQALMEDLASATLLALVDGTGKGKTQLAREIHSRTKHKEGWWISLSGTASTIGSHLREQLIRWLIERTSDYTYWNLFLYGRIEIEQIGREICTIALGDALLVIDDLPNPDDNEFLYQDLNTLIRYFATGGCKLLITSQWPLPPEIASIPAVSVRTVPNLTGEEVGNLLLSAGAPKQFAREGVLGLIIASTEGNPSLVSATVNWLRRIEWNLDDSGFSDLLFGRPTHELRIYKRTRLLRLLDNEPRELLHRLTLIEDPFDRSLALEIAGVEPRLNFPGDAFNQLTSPWLESLEHNTYRVSPILKGAGKENLASETQRFVHLAIAEHLLAADSIPTSQVVRIASHLYAARDYERFAGFLVQAMQFATSPQKAKYLDKLSAVSHYFSGRPLPDALSLNLKIVFRAAQVRIRMLVNERYDDLSADLDRLLAQAGPDNATAVVFALMFTGPLLGTMLPHEEAVPAAKKAILATRLLHQSDIFSEDEVAIQYEELIWIPVWSMSDESQLEQFLEEIKQLSDVELIRLFRSKIAVESASQLVDKRWMLEADKPEEDRNWGEVLSYLDRVKQAGAQAGEITLEAVQARARAIVLSDYLHQVDEAIAIFNDLPDLSELPRLSFLVHYTCGCILHDNDRLEKALQEFDLAVAVQV